MKRRISREWMAFIGLGLVIGLGNGLRFNEESSDAAALNVVVALYCAAAIAVLAMILSARKVNGRLWTFSQTAFCSSVVAWAMVMLVSIAGGAIVLIGSTVLFVCIIALYSGAGLVLSVLTE